MILSVGAYLLFKIKYSNQTSGIQASGIQASSIQASSIQNNQASKFILRKSLFYCAFILFAIATAFFTCNNFINSNSKSASSVGSSVGTLPEQVSIEVSSQVIYGKENSAIPLKVKITNGGNAVMQDVHLEGQSDRISIPPNSTAVLLVNIIIKSFTSHKNMNITLNYSSSGIKYSKPIETSIYPIPNAEIKELEIKREPHNFIFPDQLEPGENLTLRLKVVNKGTSKLPPSSIKILGFMDDFEAAENVSKLIDVGLNQNGEYPYEITFKINENPPYGETKANVALIYNDTLKGEITLDQRSLQIKIVPKGIFF
ncbi:MAG: hypothetical protein QXJ68_00385 [Methanocellales archaeon]